MKKLFLFLLLTLTSSAFGQAFFARWSEMNVGVPFWIAFTDNLDSGSWNSSTTLTPSGGCSPSIVSSYFKGANPPFNHQEIMALVNPGTCTGSFTLTDSVYSLSFTMTVRNPVTWYVRPDGDTRYTASFSTGGHCSGLGDQSYAAAGGSGVNQNCAMGDLRYLWVNAFTYDSTAESMFNFIQIAGGDTVIVRGAHTDGTSWRIGQNGPNSGDYFFLAGDNREAWMPTPPNGTAAFPTKILGENYASCSNISTTAGVTTHVNGGYGLVAAMNFAQQSVDHLIVNCFDVDDHESCGVSTNVDGCSSSFPVSDYIVNGILVSNLMTNTTIENFSEHGAAADAMNGPTGDGTLFLNTRWFGNAGDGWNEDNGTTDQRNVFLGTTIMRNYVFGWNGCAEQWPIVSSEIYGDCTDQDSGGAGDAFGTATLANLTAGHVWFDQGTIFNSTQDGWDALHLHGAGSTMTITRGLGYTNMGDQVKIGGTGGLVANTISVGNCTGMAYWQPGMVAPEATITSWTTNGTTAFFTTAPGNTIIAGRSYALSGFTTGTFFNGNTRLVASGTGLSSTTFQVPFSSSVASGSESTAVASGANGRLSNFCRGVYANVYETDSNTTSGWYFNTAYSSANVTVAAIGNTTPGDTTQVFQFQNNIANNFISQAGSGTYSNPIEADFGTNPFTNPGGAMAYNLTHNWPGSWTCPNTGLGEVHALCVDPQLTDGTLPLYGLPPSGVSSFIPLTGSPVLGAGAALSALTDCLAPDGTNVCMVDYFGNARSSTNPSMGAVESNGTPTVATPMASPVAGTYSGAQSVTLSDATGGATICATTDGSTPTVVSNACSGGTTFTYTVPISVTTTKTIKAIATLATFTDSNIFSGLYTITTPSPSSFLQGVKLTGVKH